VYQHGTDTDLNKIHKDAGVWVSKMDRGLTEKETIEFSKWLAKNPAHSDAYQKQLRNWRRLDSMVDWRPEHDKKLNPDLLAPAKSQHLRSKIVVVAPILALAACLLLMFTWVFQHENPTDSFEEVVPFPEEVMGVELADGSRLIKKGDAEYEVAYTSEERGVHLLQGEVYFDVAKNPDRPFVVYTDNIRFRAVGTAFNVRYMDQSVELLVEEGVVALEEEPSLMEQSDADISSPIDLGVAPKEMLLTENQKVIVKVSDRSSPLEVKLLSTSMRLEELAWQHRKLNFKDQTLQSICDEFNRLNVSQILISDPALSQIRITGNIESNNTDGFLRLLSVGFGIESKQIDESTFLLFNS